MSDTEANTNVLLNEQEATQEEPKQEEPKPKKEKRGRPKKGEESVGWRLSRANRIKELTEKLEDGQKICGRCLKIHDTPDRKTCPKCLLSCSKRQPEKKKQIGNYPTLGDIRKRMIRDALHGVHVENVVEIGRLGTAYKLKKVTCTVIFSEEDYELPTEEEYESPTETIESSGDEVDARSD